MDENVSTLLHWRLLLLLLLLLAELVLTSATWLPRLTSWLLSWNDVSSVILVVLVVGEQIVLLGVNDGLNDLSGVVSLLAQALHDQVHDLRDERWETLEDLVHDVVGDLFKLRVRVLNELKSWVSQLLQLWSDQVDEHVN